MVVNPSKAVLNQYVILLHGLARSSHSMGKLAKALADKGYLIVNVNYPSTKYKIEVLAQKEINEALGKCAKGSIVHFVTHSMGGILIRQYLNENNIDNLGQVIMLGPPNKGSEVVDKLCSMPGFKFINGPAGMQLGTGKLSIPKRLGRANFDVGIIAGTRSINLILSAMLPSPDDGTVSVENTKIEGMLDHIELPVTHSFMMRNNSVIQQVIYFLEQGSFQRS